MFYTCLNCDRNFIFEPKKCDCGELFSHKRTKEELKDFLEFYDE